MAATDRLSSSTGEATLTVKSPFAAVSLPTPYLYEAPSPLTVTSIAPTTGPKVGGTYFQAEADALRQLARNNGGPADALPDLEERTPELFERFRKRSRDVLIRVREELAAGGSFPDLDPTPTRRGHDCRLRLGDTAGLLEEGIDSGQAKQNYEKALTTVLQAFAAAEPERPMAMLLAETCCAKRPPGD